MNTSRHQRDFNVSMTPNGNARVYMAIPIPDIASMRTYMGSLVLHWTSGDFLRKPSLQSNVDSAASAPRTVSSSSQFERPTLSVVAQGEIGQIAPSAKVRVSFQDVQGLDNVTVSTRQGEAAFSTSKTITRSALNDTQFRNGSISYRWRG